MESRTVLLLVVVMVLACAFPASAEVRRTVHIDSVPSGAQVFLLVAGDRTPIGTTPLDYAAEFHSELSVLRLRIERAGYAAYDLDLAADRDRVVATLAATSVVAAAADQSDPALKALQDRIGPGASSAIRQLLATKAAADVRLDGAALLRRIDGRVYLQVSLALGYPVGTGDPAEPARRLWREIGADLAGRLGQSLPAGSGVAGVVLLGRLGGNDPSFGVTSHAESTTEMSCIPGSKSVYDSCAIQAPSYETSCYNGNCSTRQTGTHCAGGMKSVYDPCATMGPLTKFSVKVDPVATAGVNGGRVIAVAEFATKGHPVALAQFDSNGRAVLREGRLPAVFD